MVLHGLLLGKRRRSMLARWREELTSGRAREVRRVVPLLGIPSEPGLQMLRSRSPKATSCTTSSRRPGRCNRSDGLPSELRSNDLKPCLRGNHAICTSGTASTSPVPVKCKAFPSIGKESSLIECALCDRVQQCSAVLYFRALYAERSIADETGMMWGNLASSCQVLKAATKLLAALIETRPELLVTFYKQVSPVLISRFGDLEETVKLEVWSTYSALLNQTRVCVTAALTRTTL